LDEAKHWIRTHPARFVQLCLERALCFWIYPDPFRAKTVFLGLTAILGLLGLVSAFRYHPVTGGVLLIILAIYPLPSYLIHVGVRQQYPIQWLLTLLTIYFLLQRRQNSALGAESAQTHALAS
jgi:hypothetical protein